MTVLRKLNYQYLQNLHINTAERHRHVAKILLLSHFPVRDVK